MFIRSQNVRMGHLDLSNVSYISTEAEKTILRTRVRPGDVLLNITGASIGRVSAFDLKNVIANVNQHVCVIRPDSQILDYRYLTHLIATPSFQTKIDRMQAGGTRQALTFSKISNFDIPLPSLLDQKRIAAILDKAEALREKRRQAIAKLDELLQSVFLDIFGDPVTNPKGWPEGSIEMVIQTKSDLRCGPFGTQLKVDELVKSGVPLWGIENVLNNRFVAETTKYITKQKAEYLRVFSIKPGDVLITRMGTIGRACVVPDEISEGCISYHLFRVRPDRKKCLPEFLSATICRSGTFQNQLNRLAHGAIMSGLSTTMLKEIVFLLPPIDMQKKYVSYVKLIEKEISAMNKSSGEHNKLFASLQHRAFKGEL